MIRLRLVHKLCLLGLGEIAGAWMLHPSAKAFRMAVGTTYAIPSAASPGILGGLFGLLDLLRARFTGVTI